MGGTDLAGLRVLVVEDELLVSLLIEQVLAEQECVVLGPCSRVAEALEIAQGEVVHVALLDVNLAGDMVYPVAELLATRGVPFLLLSGYGKMAVPAEHPDWPFCSKPFRPDNVVDWLREQVCQGAGKRGRVPGDVGGG